MAKIETEKAINFIERYYKAIHGIEDISNGIGCNYNYLRENFVRETGFTLTDFLNLTRCKNAENLLRHTSWKIYSIAREVGFHDDKYFIKVFKKYFGLPPNTFRKQL